jgi:hypothetical protein
MKDSSITIMLLESLRPQLASTDFRLVATKDNVVVFSSVSVYRRFIYFKNSIICY